MSYTSEKFNVAMKNAMKIAGQDLERMNNDWAKLREKSNKEIPKMLKDAAKEATASLKIDNEKLKEKLIEKSKAHLQLLEIDLLKTKENKKLLEDLKESHASFKEEREENKKLKEENEKIGELVISQTDKLKEVSIKYNEGYKINQELKEEITTLVTFTIGGGDPEETSDVEKIITDTMSKEFIDNNQEHWDLIGLFED